MSDNKCPVHHTSGGSTSNRNRRPNRPRPGILQRCASPSILTGGDFNDADTFSSLGLDALKRDSQEWRPEDFGRHAPLFFRMARHSAGTCRIGYGRQHSQPLNSRSDHVNPGKARRLSRPVRQKHMRRTSASNLFMFQNHFKKGTP